MAGVGTAEMYIYWHLDRWHSIGTKSGLGKLAAEKFRAERSVFATIVCRLLQRGDRILNAQDRELSASRLGEFPYC